MHDPGSYPFKRSHTCNSPQRLTQHKNFNQLALLFTPLKPTDLKTLGCVIWTFLAYLGTKRVLAGLAAVAPSVRQFQGLE